jgi:hypothetical protein
LDLVFNWSRDRSKILTWRRDGREIYFLADDGALMAVGVGASGQTISITRPQALFKIPLNHITMDWFSPYDVAPDGQRFLLNVPERPEPLLFLHGLDAMLARRK